MDNQVNNPENNTVPENTQNNVAATQSENPENNITVIAPEHTRNHQMSGIIDLRNDSRNSEFQSVKVNDVEKRKNHNNKIAGLLAITAWTFFLGVIGYTTHKINYYADLIIETQDEKKIARIEKAKEITEDHANTINTVLGTITGSITAFYLSRRNEENNNNEEN